MIYQFKCNTCVAVKSLALPVSVVPHYIFEVNQPMLSEHRANCPICGKPAQRVWSAPIHYEPWDLWNKDGSHQSDSTLPTAYRGPGRYFPGM
jgi:hypothetical protein